MQRWIQVARDVPRELQRMVASVEKSGTPTPKGKITSEVALDLTRKIEDPGRRLEAAEELARRSVPQRIARRVIKRIPTEHDQPVTALIGNLIEKEESRIVTELDTGEILDCPICHTRVRLVHKDPKGHAVEEVQER